MDYSTFLAELGKNIRTIRKAKNLTMEDVAFYTDIEYRHIGRIERGEVNTTVVSLLRISNYLQVDIITFFQKTNNNFLPNQKGDTPA